MSEHSATTQALLAAEHSIMHAIQNKDAQRLKQLLSPDFRLRMPGNPELQLNGFIEAILSIPGQMEAIHGLELATQLIGNVGVVTGIQEASVRLADGSLATSRTAFTDVFQHTGRQWLLVLASAVEVGNADAKSKT